MDFSCIRPRAVHGRKERKKEEKERKDKEGKKKTKEEKRDGFAGTRYQIFPKLD